jgi:hypothetical protein
MFPKSHTIAALVAFSLASTSGAAQQASQRSSTILYGGTARRALAQCTRAHPDTALPLWVPDRAALDGLERGIGRLLTRMLDSARQRVIVPNDVSATDYYRQYIGVVVNGRRLIYVNGFHVSFLKVLQRANQPSPGDSALPSDAYAFDWERQAVTVCDGGIGFFGVLYDPARNSFYGFYFNQGA